MAARGFISRRGLLQISAGALASELLRPLGPACALADQAGSPPRWADAAGRSLVVKARSDHVVSDGLIHDQVLAEMMGEALLVLAGASTPRQAWSRLLRSRRTVGLLLEGLPDDPVHTALPVARWLITSLVDSGWSPDDLVVRHGASELTSEMGLRARCLGWSAAPLDFGSGADQLSAFVEEVDAIVSVPLLKDDNVTGLGGCVKGASYDLLKHPARYHQGGGSPFLPDVLALPQLQDKLCLHVLNALRVVYDGGPLVHPNFINDSGILLLGRDPVATDVLGLRVLNEIRTSQRLQPIPLDESRVPTLFHASRRGLGRVDLRQITQKTVVVG